MHKLTAIVTCFNESQHIEGVLQSIAWCDEIIVVDSFSTDDTLVKAKKYTQHV
ncbi:MAG: glycosyltransferase, partial [Chitinophagales bacterium]